MPNQKFIITGGPGSGKTSLINALAGTGYQTFEEVSRRLIKQHIILNKDVLPWKNMEKFAALALAEMHQQYQEACQHNAVCFFDRGIPDIEGYLQFSGLPVSNEILHAYETIHYARQVFICPPWKEIYKNDPERPQHFGESVALYHHIRITYQRLGYTTIEIPKTDLSQRVMFIMEKISGVTQHLPHTEHL